MCGMNGLTIRTIMSFRYSKRKCTPGRLGSLVTHSRCNSYPDSIDLKMMHAVGQNLPAVLRGEITMLEPMVQDNMLNKFYVDAFGMPSYLQDLTRMARQISHRYPHMSILEIGMVSLFFQCKQCL